ncbi:MAG TPA: AbrB/MazE/SpoVT family DNA-binding domain-containing protein [Opitutales bacterium]|nr:AbrB/MazE/SpoVT family DNA-binding domain-containing protein [Opitutales bacterium]
MKLTQKCQVTIPHRLRKRYGLNAHSEVIFEATEAGVLLKSAPTKDLKQLGRAIDSVRGCADAGLSTEAIMQMTRD